MVSSALVVIEAVINIIYLAGRIAKVPQQNDSIA